MFTILKNLKRSLAIKNYSAFFESSQSTAVAYDADVDVQHFLLNIAEAAIANGKAVLYFTTCADANLSQHLSSAIARQKCTPFYINNYYLKFDQNFDLMNRYVRPNWKTVIKQNGVVLTGFSQCSKATGQYLNTVNEVFNDFHRRVSSLNERLDAVIIVDDAVHLSCSSIKSLNELVLLGATLILGFDKPSSSTKFNHFKELDFNEWNLVITHLRFHEDVELISHMIPQDNSSSKSAYMIASSLQKGESLVLLKEDSEPISFEYSEHKFNLNQSIDIANDLKK